MKFRALFALLGLLCSACCVTTSAPVLPVVNLGGTVSVCYVIDLRGLGGNSNVCPTTVAATNTSTNGATITVPPGMVVHLEPAP